MVISARYSFHGIPIATEMKFRAIRGKSLINRFEEKFTKKSVEECWEWLGNLQAGYRYGRFYMNGSNGYAHRASYKIYIGEPGELYVLHKCDNTSCVNPNHLFLGSHQDNMKDRDQKGRQYHILTSVDRGIIKEAILAGYTMSSIARYFKRHKTTIHDIKKRMICGRL